MNQLQTRVLSRERDHQESCMDNDTTYEEVDELKIDSQLQHKP